MPGDIGAPCLAKLDCGYAIESRLCMPGSLVGGGGDAAESAEKLRRTMNLRETIDSRKPLPLLWVFDVFSALSLLL